MTPCPWCKGPTRGLMNKSFPRLCDNCNSYQQRYAPRASEIEQAVGWRVSENDVFPLDGPYGYTVLIWDEPQQGPCHVPGVTIAAVWAD